MGYRSLADCVRDLETTGQLVTIEQEIDPYLEVAAIQRRVYQAGGPALLFRRAKGTSFPLVGNLFGTLDRAKFIFRDALESVRLLVELKVDPGPRQKPMAIPRHTAARSYGYFRPSRALRADPSPPDYDLFNCRKSNVGRWTAARSSPCPRFIPRTPTGLGWHVEPGDVPDPARRAIGITESRGWASLSNSPRNRRSSRGRDRAGRALRVNVFVGGPPALTVAAVMPLPEGLPELAFAGVGGRRVAMVSTRRVPTDAG